ncbi:hypothetical protein SCO02_12940 [Staphylococcus ureilyticus]|uniref:Uncharacterized protein n=1 Tax=Staphylococcus ureilyticus TaxID=94138 RepID=A0AB34AI26_STAUR|nr:hypothetical protein [Staphylococcus ureilyticus]GEQ02853.1 hypothetical protein SCO02_12940 [Staphylococcus ureilyticus]
MRKKKRVCRSNKFESENTLELLYRSLNCRMINIGFYINNIDIWVDDEAIYSSNYN